MRILCCLGRREFKNVKFHPLPSLPTLTKYFTFYSVSAFSFYLKKKTPAKEKQTQGFAPRPRERRAAVHGLCYSVGSSAHSPANALELERVRARAACVASRPLASSVSLFHCGAAIGGLFLIIYQVARFTFWQMSSSVFSCSANF